MTNASSRRERRRLCRRRSACRIHGRPSNRSGARRLDAADRGAGERMAADEAQARGKRARRSAIVALVLPTSVTSARRRTYVGEPSRIRMFCAPERRGRSGRRPPTIDEIVAPDVDRVKPQRGLERRPCDRPR